MSFHRLAALLAVAVAAMAPWSARAEAIWSLDALLAEPTTDVSPLLVAARVPADAAPAAATASPDAAAPETSGKRLRRVLADLSMSLRHIRYKMGGRDPATGFDCSGFVRYVFRHGAGLDLPMDSASQYRSGNAIARENMKTGDLVFFRTSGKRVSHVGIYIGNGRFIHAPSSGKAVSISRMDNSYWAARFVGARRPDVLS